MNLQWLLLQQKAAVRSTKISVYQGTLRNNLLRTHQDDNHLGDLLRNLLVDSHLNDSLLEDSYLTDSLLRSQKSHLKISALTVERKVSKSQDNSTNTTLISAN
jgi:hypothetical protein